MELILREVSIGFGSFNFDGKHAEELGKSMTALLTGEKGVCDG